jgi:hypothetical protein
MANAIDINDREGLRKVLREINFDDYKTSEGMKSLIEEDRKNGTSYREGMISEDQLIEVFRYLRTPSGRGNKSNLEYLSEYKKEKDPKYAYGTQYHMPCGVKDALMEEKKKEEREYYGMKFPMSYESNHSNVVQENVEKPKPSLDEIKARYMAEMDALTKRFQDEINNLG